MSHVATARFAIKTDINSALTRIIRVILVLKMSVKWYKGNLLNHNTDTINITVTSRLKRAIAWFVTCSNLAEVQQNCCGNFHRWPGHNITRLRETSCLLVSIVNGHC